jgi:hypothetical protein
MSWWHYVLRTALTESPKELSAETGIDGPNFSKWKAGQIPGPTLVAKFARAYERPVLEAFVAAGFLTAEEAKVRPSAAPDLSRLTNDELLELVRARMGRAGELGGNTAATSGVSQDEAATISQMRRQHSVRRQAAKRGDSVGKARRREQDEDATN